MSEFPSKYNNVNNPGNGQKGRKYSRCILWFNVVFFLISLGLFLFAVPHISQLTFLHRDLKETKSSHQSCQNNITSLATDYAQLKTEISQCTKDNNDLRLDLNSTKQLLATKIGQNERLDELVTTYKQQVAELKTTIRLKDLSTDVLRNSILSKANEARPFVRSSAAIKMPLFLASISSFAVILTM